jgi:hypothetical protein
MVQTEGNVHASRRGWNNLESVNLESGPRREHHSSSLIPHSYPKWLSVRSPNVHWTFASFGVRELTLKTSKPQTLLPINRGARFAHRMSTGHSPPSGYVSSSSSLAPDSRFQIPRLFRNYDTRLSTLPSNSNPSNSNPPNSNPPNSNPPTIPDSTLSLLGCINHLLSVGISKTQR